MADPLASKRKALVAAMTAAGKPPPKRDIAGLIAQAPEPFLDMLLAHYGDGTRMHVW